MSSVVQLRRKGCGVTASHLLQLVLGESLRLTAIGLVGGAALAYVVSRGLTAMLYNVSRLDPTVYAVSAVAMLSACAAAAALPARRAAQVDPVTALRAE